MRGTIMKHLGTKEIQTDRLILRKFKHSDVNFAFKNWCNDDRVTKHLMWPTHADVSVTQNIINEWVKSYEKDNFYLWAIVLKETGEPIGSISIVEINEKCNCVQIGYAIGFEWWNKGIVSQAFSAIIPFIFEKMKANRIGANHDINNPASGKVMLKCNLKYEGTLRQADYNNQGIVDVACYSILASEYNEKHKLKNGVLP